MNPVSLLTHHVCERRTPNLETSNIKFLSISHSHWKKEAFKLTSAYPFIMTLYSCFQTKAIPNFLNLPLFPAEFLVKPVFNRIDKWYAKFRKEGCLCTHHRPGRPGPSNETVNRIREAYQRIHYKSTTRASLQLGDAQSTPWRILRKRLRWKSTGFRCIRNSAKYTKMCVFGNARDLQLAASPTPSSLATKQLSTCLKR